MIKPVIEQDIQGLEDRQSSCCLPSSISYLGRSQTRLQPIDTCHMVTETVIPVDPCQYYEPLVLISTFTGP